MRSIASTSHPCRWEGCTHTFGDLDRLVGHLQDDHISKEKPKYHCKWAGCDRNGNPLGNRSKIIEHLRTHTREQPFRCEMPGCLKRFTKRSSVIGHYKRYHGMEEDQAGGKWSPDPESGEVFVLIFGTLSRLTIW